MKHPDRHAPNPGMNQPDFFPETMRPGEETTAPLHDSATSRRLYALEIALGHAQQGTLIEDIIDAATKIEAYLAGGKSE